MNPDQRGRWHRRLESRYRHHTRAEKQEAASLWFFGTLGVAFLLGLWFVVKQIGPWWLGLALMAAAGVVAVIALLSMLFAARRETW